MSSSPGLGAQAAGAARAATLAAGALIAQQVAGRAVRDALFLGAFPVSALPLAMTGAAVVSLGAVLAFARLLQRHGPARVVNATVAVSAALLVSEWALAHVAPRAAAVAVYLHLAFFGATLVSGFWSLVNESFDPYSAKRAMGRIGVGASLGGVAGGALAFATSRLFPAQAVLLLMVLLHALAVAGLRRLRPERGAAPRALDENARVPALLLLRRTRYLRDLALLVALGAAGEALLDYHLGAQAAARLQGSQALAGFFAAFHTATGLLALLAQTLLSRPALETLGLAGTTGVRPALVMGFGVLGAALPQLWSASLLRGAEAVARHSLFRSGYELLFTPLPPREKRATKTLIDVGFDRLGTAVGGALAFLIASLGATHAARALPAGAALLALGALVTALRLHAGYVRALEASLRAGLIEIDEDEVQDATTRLTLRTSLTRHTLGLSDDAAPGATGAAAFLAALRDADPRRAREALRSEEARDPLFAAHVVPLLARDELAREALLALRAHGRRAAGVLGDALLHGSDARVRRRVTRALRACGGERAALALLLGLDDPDFGVRRACGRALSFLAARGEARPAPPERLLAVAQRELAALAVGTDVPPVALRHVFTLLALALEREEMQLAFRALQTEGVLRGTALEYLETVLPDELRQDLFPRLGVTPRPRAASSRPREELREELRTRLGLRG